MATVKCTAYQGVSLASGRRLTNGEQADDVDVTEPTVRAHLAAQRLVIVGDALDVTDHTIDEILDWVGDDQERAASALAGEQRRAVNDQRSTLIDRLGELIDIDTNDDHPAEEA